MEPIQVFEDGNRRLEIYHDEYPESPDTWEDNDAFIIYDHDSFQVEVKGFSPQEVYEEWSAGKKLYNGYYIFPVYAYIHSGVSLSLDRGGIFSCRWDVSFKGFCLVKRQKHTYNEKATRIIAEVIVNVWNEYLSGDVYGYQLFEDDKEIHSCWGYYGSDSIDLICKENNFKPEFEKEVA